MYGIGAPPTDDSGKGLGGCRVTGRITAVI